MCGSSPSPPPPDYGPLADAQRDAAELQYKASQENREAFKESQRQAREDIAPWRKAGLSALQNLQKGVKEGKFSEKMWEDPSGEAPEWKWTEEGPKWGGFDEEAPEWGGFSEKDFKADPGYQFRLSEGTKAVKRSAAARGNYDSGATMKALTKYGQGLASQEFSAARGRAVQDYQFGVLEHDRKRSDAVQDYQFGVQDYQRRRGEGYQDYMTGVSEYENSRQRAMQNYQLRQQQRTMQYNRLAGLAGTGQTATQNLINVDQQSTARQAQQTQMGAQALGAGEVGAQNALVRAQEMSFQAAQQRNNNLMQMLGIAGGYALGGAFGGIFGSLAK